MKVNELRIGNLIEYCDFPNKGNIAVGHTLFTNCFNDPNYLEYFYKPIPLTKEWLIEFGFKYKNPGSGGQDQWSGYGFWSFNDVHFLGIKDGKILYFNRDRRTQIAYVHQLQNLYYAISGQEITIK